MELNSSFLTQTKTVFKSASNDHEEIFKTVVCIRSFLCTRLGIQAKANILGTKDIAPSHQLSIRAQWATKFADKVELILAVKKRS